MIKVLGIMDLIAAIIFILLKFSSVSHLAWFFVLYLIIKGILFFNDLNSFMDLGSGVFMMMAILGFFPFLSWIFIFWLIQKGFLSLI